MFVASIVVLWISSFAALLAATETEQCPFPSSTITNDELQSILARHGKWLDLAVSPFRGYTVQHLKSIDMATRNASVPGRAVLCNKILRNLKLDAVELSGADLRGADLTGTSMRGAHLFGVNLNGACLERTILAKADLTGAYLRQAVISGADLSDAFLSYASLRDAIIERASVARAKIDNVDLNNAFYSPESEPPNPYVGTLYGLESVTYLKRFTPTNCAGPEFEGTPVGLVQLRKVLIESGDAKLEREATFAIEHARTLQLLDEIQLYWPNLSFEDSVEITKRKLYVALDPEKWLSGIEGVVRLALFEWTAGYGLRPARPLLILLIGIFAFAVIYWSAIAHSPSPSSGIFRVWPKDRIGITRKGLDFLEQKVERVSATPLKALLYALQFSALSAFYIGWREFNLGSWLARIQTDEYALQARGWVRSVSGCQAVLSVYLLALAILTYFGRPF
ncbi:MAG TPA: pentapeptide repeat-containing protein [Verrucomicrobiae bacterium]|nr:pentapeptide repeat-containing protein [Verrucomicrobiae bacterium]